MMANKANASMSRKPSNELDKDAFLKLFITQVQNQDPLNPDNSSQMAAQLAQFNGLEQMMNVNKNLEKMQTDAAMSRAVNLVTFVGKDLKLDTGKLRWAGGKLTDSVFKLDGDAGSLKLEVRDSAGVVVSNENLGASTAGEHKLAWKGTDNAGRKVPDGVYTFSVIGKDASGEDVAAKITSTVKVSGVDLKDSGGAFYTDVGKVGINEVSSVGDTGFVGKAAEAEARHMQDAMKAATAAATGHPADAAGADAGDGDRGKDEGKAAEVAPIEAVKAVDGPKQASAPESKAEPAVPPANSAARDNEAAMPTAAQRIPIANPSVLGSNAPGMQFNKG